MIVINRYKVFLINTWVIESYSAHLLEWFYLQKAKVKSYIDTNQNNLKKYLFKRSCKSSLFNYLGYKNGENRYKFIKIDRIGFM